MSTTVPPLQAAFYDLLFAQSSITDISDTNSKNETHKIGKQIRPDALKANDVPPWIVIEIQNDDQIGDLAGTDGQGIATVAVVCCGHSRLKADEIATAANEILNDFAGTSAGVSLQEVTHLRDLRTYEPPQDQGDQDHWFYTIPQFHVMYAI